MHPYIIINRKVFEKALNASLKMFNIESDLFFLQAAYRPLTECRHFFYFLLRSNQINSKYIRLYMEEHGFIAYKQLIHKGFKICQSKYGGSPEIIKLVKSIK